MAREKNGLIKSDRESLDFYATNPKDVIEIVNELCIDKNSVVLEPCAGNGHISKTLEKLGIKTISNDIIERDYELDYISDYLTSNIEFDCDLVIMNPPFKFAKEFIEKSLEHTDKVLIIARLDLLESAKRKELNNKHLTKIFVHSSRARFAKNGEEHFFSKSSSMSTAWFLYEKEKSNFEFKVL